MVHQTKKSPLHLPPSHRLSVPSKKYVSGWLGTLQLHIEPALKMFSPLVLDTILLLNLIFFTDPRVKRPSPNPLRESHKHLIGLVTSRWAKESQEARKDGTPVSIPQPNERLYLKRPNRAFRASKQKF